MSRWPTLRQKYRAFEAIGYQPFGSQVAIHESGARILLIAGGERSGKSRSSAAEVFARTPWCQQARRVGIVSQQYTESRAECQYLLDDFEGLNQIEGRASTPRQGKWEWQHVSGVHFETISLQHSGTRELTGRGKAYDVILVAEAGLVTRDAFLGAVGRVAETRGLIILSGTLWDSIGWYPDLYDTFAGLNIYNGERFILPSWDNTAVYPGGKQDPEILRLKDVLPEDEYLRRVAAKLMPSPARIYREFSNPTHIRELTFDPTEPVYLSVDPGYDPSHYVVLALQPTNLTYLITATQEGEEAVTQRIDMEGIQQVGEVYEQKLTHTDVIQICRTKPWWSNVKGIIVGHEGKQHHGGKSTQEVWNHSLGLEEGDPKVRMRVVKRTRVLDGIMRVRTFLKDPMTKQSRYFCDVNCTGTQYEFKAYQRKTDSQGVPVSDEPVDRHNDCMDALRNFLVDRYGFVKKRKHKSVPSRRVAMWG